MDVFLGFEFGGNGGYAGMQFVGNLLETVYNK